MLCNKNLMYCNLKYDPQNHDSIWSPVNQQCLLQLECIYIP
jgi:hypothetical protein